MNSTEFLKKINSKKKISTKIRLYIIEKNNHYLINEGRISSGFEAKISLSKNRKSVLDAFSKMAFLFDEIIRLRIVGPSGDSESKELLYVLNLVPVNRKIRTFLDWNVFGPEFTRNMSRLFEVRNDAIHCVSIDEVTYRPKKNVSLATLSGFKRFQSDLVVAWSKLLKTYVMEQEKINWQKLYELS